LFVVIVVWALGQQRASVVAFEVQADGLREVRQYEREQTEQAERAEVAVRGPP